MKQITDTHPKEKTIETGTLLAGTRFTRRICNIQAQMVEIPNIGKVAATVYDIVEEETLWRHGNPNNPDIRQQSLMRHIVISPQDYQTYVNSENTPA
jgi:hypothetical protein